MSKTKKEALNPSLSELVRKFSKNDVIAEMEKEYQRVAAKNVPLSLIDDNIFVKRVQIPSEILERVEKSIKERGIFNPLVVRPSGSHYELILGRKRYFAAKMAGLKEVPAVIADVGDEETLLMLLADTRDQREADVVEMALVYQALSEKFDYSQATLADLAHQSRSQVTNTMRILRLPDHVISEISAGLLSYGHAKAIASLSDEEVEEVVRLIHQEKLSVRQTEELAKQYSTSLPQLMPDRAELLKEALGAQSVILKKNGISISFLDETERDAFLAKLEKKQ
jgi:ParB family chromosome partitioning protein